MHTTSLILDLKEREISALLTLCQSGNRGRLAELCESPELAAALGSALDEITWQDQDLARDFMADSWRNTVLGREVPDSGVSLEAHL